MGIACTTALIRISLPTCESNFASHPCNFLQTFSFMKLKLAFFLLPAKDDNPRYFSYCLISSTPKACLMCSLVSFEVSLLKKMMVLFRLICWSEQLPYTSSISKILLHSYSVALQKRRLSSKKRRCVSLGLFLHKAYPLMSPWLVTWDIRPFNPSVHSKNKKGDSGSPCLMPRVGTIMPLGS